MPNVLDTPVKIRILPLSYSISDTLKSSEKIWTKSVRKDEVKERVVEIGENPLGARACGLLR